MEGRKEGGVELFFDPMGVVVIWNKGEEENEGEKGGKWDG